MSKFNKRFSVTIGLGLTALIIGAVINLLNQKFEGSMWFNAVSLALIIIGVVFVLMSQLFLNSTDSDHSN